MRVAFVSDLQLRDDRLEDRARSLEALAAELEERAVEALVVAGDVFHYRRPGVDELLLFRRWLETLPIDVVLVAGNHDLRGPHLPATVDLFAGYRHGASSTAVFTTPGTVYLASSTFESPPVVLGVLPWAHPATMRAAGYLDRQDLADAIVRAARDLAVDAGSIATTLPGGSDAVPVLVTHHALDGTMLPTGLPVRELMGETILDTAALLEQGWRYIFAGHIHADGLIRTMIDESALAGDYGAAYSIGVPWRHDFGEASLEPGFLVLDTAADTVEKVELSDRRFVTIEPDGYEAGAPLILADAIEVAGDIVRVRVKARHGQDVDVAGIRERLLDVGAHEVKVVVDVERNTRARLETDAAEELEPLEALNAWIGAQGSGLELGTGDALRELLVELLEVIR